MAEKQKWIDCTREILLKLNLPDEYRTLGLDVCGRQPSSKGWIEARSFGVEDRTPSAGICVADGAMLGRYKDFRGDTMGLFDFAAKVGKFPDWRAARNHYAHVAGVEHNGRRAASASDWTTCNPCTRWYSEETHLPFRSPAE